MYNYTQLDIPRPRAQSKTAIIVACSCVHILCTVRFSSHTYRVPLRTFSRDKQGKLNERLMVCTLCIRAL